MLCSVGAPQPIAQGVKGFFGTTARIDCSAVHLDTISRLLALSESRRDEVEEVVPRLVHAVTVNARGDLLRWVPCHSRAWLSCLQR